MPKLSAGASPGAKICVACGINIKTGRPLLTSHDIDEDELNEKAHQTIQVRQLDYPVRALSDRFRGVRHAQAVCHLGIVDHHGVDAACCFSSR